MHSTIRYILVVALITLGSATAKAQLQKTVALLKGELATLDGGKLSGATVSIYKGSSVVLTTRSNSDGQFTSVLQPGTTYRVTINHPMYMYSEDTVVIPPSDKYVEVPFHASIRALHDGQDYQIDHPIFFPGSATIEKTVQPDLASLIVSMKHNTKLTIEITVYPDVVIKGGKKDAKAQQLVMQRANAFRSFLMASGVSDRVVAIHQATTVPPGKFPQTVSTTTGKKKRVKTTTELVPQYAEIVTHLS